jgi:hypothetical protein
MHARQFAKPVLIAALLCGRAPFQVSGAYLDTGTGTPDRQEIAPPVRLPGPFVPPEINPLRRLLARVDVGRPRSDGRLTIFPLELRGAGDQTDIRTLDEALSRGWLAIREQDQARVSEVVVRNESAFTVFMMAGEILSGGRQDRIIRSDVLVRPGRDAVTVPVYCGEQDRWKGDREAFDRAPHLASQTMRGMAARAATQEAIWTEIDGLLKESGASSPTRSYQSLYGDPDTRRRIDALAERFREIQTRRTVGWVIVDRGRVVSGDVFGDPDLCARLWDKVLRSHAADFIMKDDDRRHGDAASDVSAAVRRFLEAFGAASQARENTPGAGESFALQGRVDGHALVWDGSLVHAAAFSRELYR